MRRRNEDKYSLEQYLWSKSQMDGECWVWLGNTTFGYGIARWGGRMSRVHRLVAAQKHGDIEGLVVRHTCDRRNCWRPDHLVMGTQADNMADMVARGRSHKDRKGQKNPFAKLTDVAADEIRKSPLTGRELSRQYDVSEALISMIRSGKRRAA